MDTATVTVTVTATATLVTITDTAMLTPLRSLSLVKASPKRPRILISVALRCTYMVIF